MIDYLRSMWKARFFWFSLTVNDLRSRYRGSVLGMGWSLLQPVLMTSILCFAFGSIFRQDLRVFAPFLFAGLTVWNYITGCAQQGCQCFFQAESYIRQSPAPMAIYPLRTVLSTLFHLLIALIPVIALSGYFNGLIGLPALLSLIPSLVLLTMMGWAIAALTGVLNVLFRDTRHLTDVGLQVIFYLTPILYPPNLVADRRLGLVVSANPLVPLLRLVRDTILENGVPTLEMYGSALLVVAVSCGVASAVLWRFERRLIFHL